MTKHIAVIAANGKSGSAIVKEAVDRGFDVTAIAAARTGPPPSMSCPRICST